MLMLNCLKDVKKNDYKVQLAMRKPWYYSNTRFLRKLSKFMSDFENWNAKRVGKYIVVDIYDNAEGFEKDNNLCFVESGHSDHVAWFHINDSKTIITNVEDK